MVLGNFLGETLGFYTTNSSDSLPLSSEQTTTSWAYEKQTTMHEMASKLHDTTGRADAADYYALRYHDDHDALWRGAIKCDER